MAFIASASNVDEPNETLAVVRALCDPDNLEAEFGILVRSDLKGRGIGRSLMLKLIAYLRQHGTQRLVSEVLADNRPMLDLARSLGFDVQPMQASKQQCRVSLQLRQS